MIGKAKIIRAIIKHLWEITTPSAFFDSFPPDSVHVSNAKSHRGRETKKLKPFMEHNTIRNRPSAGQEDKQNAWGRQPGRQASILDERACLHLPAEAAEDAAAAARRRRIFRWFPIILFSLLIRRPTMGSREANVRRRPTVCTLILDKADNERAVALLHSPSTASAFQRPFHAITAADGRWHLSYPCESETRYLRPTRLFSRQPRWCLTQINSECSKRYFSLQLIDFMDRDNNVIMIQMINMINSDLEASCNLISLSSPARALILRCLSYIFVNYLIFFKIKLSIKYSEL